MIARYLGRHAARNNHTQPSARALIDALAYEQFRVLVTKIGQVGRHRPTRALAVTSSIASEGKTTVAVNLAVTLAKSFGRKTLLVDADFRRPGVASLLDAPFSHGLLEVLKGEVSPSKARWQFQDKQLTVLPLVRPAPDAATLLSDPTAHDHFQEAIAGFDAVIIDAAPILPLADNNLLADLVDGFLVIVRAEQTPKRLITSALKNIPRDKIIGFVLNQSTAFGRTAYGYAYFGARNYYCEPHTVDGK